MAFDYNTSRKQMVLPEYGRNIQKMVDYVKTIEDREERNKLATAIVGVMGNLNPHLRDINDFKHKLWDHLAIIANFELDIDFPYEIPKPEMFTEKPRQVDYGTHRIKYRHYGKSIETIIESAMELEDCEEKDKLINSIANHMKKTYLSWNRDSVEDSVIIKDLIELSGGKIEEEKIQLAETKDLLNRGRRKKGFKKR